MLSFARQWALEVLPLPRIVLQLGRSMAGGLDAIPRHQHGGSPCSRPLLVILLLFLLLRAESLPTHGDVERNPGPDVDRKATSDTALDASLRSSNVTQETKKKKKQLLGLQEMQLRGFYLTMSA